MLYLTIIGIGCISYAVVTNNANYEDGAEVKRPTLLSKGKIGATLSFAKKNSKIKNSLVRAAAKPMPIQETWKTVTIQKGDTLTKIFSKLGLSQTILNKISLDSSLKKVITKLKPGQQLDFLFDSQKQFKQLKLKLSLLKTLHITTDEEDIKHYYEEKTPIKRMSFGSATISDTLYSAAQNAGLTDNLIMQMADILGWDIDFNLDVQNNDSFRILYEEEYLQDERINVGKILAMEFVNKGKTYKAVRYTDGKSREGYYSPEGFSLEKAFLRNPVKYTRISSHFSAGRRHPILHKIRSHKGVDFAAPQGTPVKSAGDGRISFVGTKGGYGKSIEVSHGQKYSTFYAHLSRFTPGMKSGTFVKQGQIIGYVGKTGLATGPHLHYEFRINGVHHNPITVSLPRATPISGQEKNDFTMHANNLLDLLDSHTQLAKND